MAIPALVKQVLELQSKIMLAFAGLCDVPGKFATVSFFPPFFCKAIPLLWFCCCMIYNQ